MLKVSMILQNKQLTALRRKLFQPASICSDILPFKFQKNELCIVDNGNYTLKIVNTNDYEIIGK